jgi:thioredoxin-like negative regulator of GroEL
LFQVLQALGRSDAVDALHRAVERADGAAEPYQQLIVAEWHAVRNSPAWRSVAIALWNRYPTDASAHMAGRALLWSGDFVGARRVAREAMQRPTIVHEAPGACRRSDLFDIIVAANLLMDSLPQAEAAAREWLAADPTSGASAWRLAEVLQRHGDPNEALRLIQQALQPTDPRTTDDVPYRIMLAVRHGELAEAERWLAPRRLDARAEVREEALWWTAILRREEGRPAEGAAALALARRQIDASERSAPSAYASLQAQLALESGDHAGAIALFDSIAALPPDPLERLDTSPGGLEARRRVWRLLHLATAIAASGDTVRLAPLVDTLRVLGARSGFGRDRRSHYFADALLQLSRGDTATAIQSLRASMYSPTEGFTRANLILGQLLTRTGDSESAVEVLEAAMRGALEGSNLFVARRELRSALRDALRQGARSRREA